MSKFFLVESKFDYDQCEHEFVTSDLFRSREAARKHLAEIVAKDKETGVCARYLDSDSTGEDDFRVITDTPDLFEAYGDGSNSVEVRVAEKSVVPSDEENIPG